MNKLKIIRSFSLIELMVVIAIIGILSAIAVPSYQSYIIKANYIQIITLMEAQKNQIAIAYNTTGSMSQAIQQVMPGGVFTITNINSIWNTTNITGFGAWPAPSNTNGHVWIHIATGINGLTPNLPTGDVVQIDMQMYDSGNDIMITACYLDSRSVQIPLSYLPAGCNGTAQDPTTYIP